MKQIRDKVAGLDVHRNTVVAAYPGRPEPAGRGEQLGRGRRSVRWRRQRLVLDLANVRTGDKLSS